MSGIGESPGVVMFTTGASKSAVAPPGWPVAVAVRIGVEATSTEISAGVPSNRMTLVTWLSDSDCRARPAWPSTSSVVIVDCVEVTPPAGLSTVRSEEHTSELQSLMRISYAVFCLKKKNTHNNNNNKKYLLV